MRMSKRVMLLCLMLAFVWTLAGCGSEKEKKPDAEELIAKMIEAAEGSVVTQSDSVAVINFRQGDELTGRDIIVTLKANNLYDKESYRASSKINYDLNGQINVDMEFNLLEEQGILYHYAWDEEFGRVKYEACFEKEDMARNFVSSMNLKNAEILGLETKDIKVGDKEAYKLSVKLKDAMIRELLFESGMKGCFKNKEYGSVDLSDVAVTMDYYVEPETAIVLKVEAKLEGMQNFIRDWLEFKLDDEAEQTIRTTKLAECTLVYDNISYDDLKLPMMSFEDKKNSLWIHQKDEIYTIKLMNCEVDILWPKGWYSAAEDNELLMLWRADDMILRMYWLEMHTNEEEIKKNYIDNAIKDYKDSGEYVEDKEGPVIGKFKTYEISLTDGVTTYAYTQLDDIWLIINVDDYTATRLDKVLPEVLEGIKLE